MMKKLLFIISVLLTAIIGKPAWPEDAALKKWQRLRDDASLRSSMQILLENEARRAFGASLSESVLVSDDGFFKKSLPLFVTLKKGDDVRGCMGALHARRGTLLEEVRDTLRMALFQDPWHRKIQAEEMSGMQIYLTAVGRPRAVKHISELSPAHDGAYLKQGGREAVVLPGEAKTQRYLLAFLKAKSGMNPKLPYQLYRLETATVAFALPAALKMSLRAQRSNLSLVSMGLLRPSASQ